MTSLIGRPGIVSRTRFRIGGLLLAASLLSLGVVAASCSSSPPADVKPTALRLAVNQFYGGSLPPMTLALTFDDGPGDYATYDGNNGEGTGISQYLHSLGIRAAFFDNGARINPTTLPNPNNIGLTANTSLILQQILSDGHIIGNHTVTHRDMTSIPPLAGGTAQLVQEIAETDNDLAGFIPSGWFLFRAPYGDYDQVDYTDLQGTAADKYVGPVYWDMGGVSTNYPDQAADWACWQGQITTAEGQPGGAAGTGYLTTTECGDAYLAEIHSVGSGIVLMHEPYYWDHGNTLAMIQYILPTLIAEGYKFVRLDDVPDIRAALPPCDASCASCSGTGPTQCTSCEGSQFLESGQCSTCSTCGTGTYLATACTTTADAQCGACDVSCATCSGAGPSACTACSAGAFLTAGGTCQVCSACDAGAFEAAACTATTDTTCTPCAPGSFSAAGASACSSCAVGTATPMPGSAVCPACAPGTSAATEGQTLCTMCAPGNVSDGGASTCSACAAGSFAASGSDDCQLCPAGTASIAGSASCTACVTGTYAASGAASCTACGDCDDGEPCTTDSCDPSLGCTHAMTPGCTVDAGASDAGDAAVVLVDAAHPDAASGADDAARPSDAGRKDAAGVKDAASPSDGGPRDAAESINGGTSSSGGCNVAHETSGSDALFGFGALAFVVGRRRRSKRAARASR